MRWIAGLGLSMLACGSVSDATNVDAQTATDAPTSDTVAGDAAVTPRCSPTAAFGTPEAVVEVNSAAYEAGGALSADELTLYLSSERGGGALDVYKAVRGSRSDAFSQPALLAGVNTTAMESNPTVTSDGLYMYVTTHSSATGYDIMVSQRASTSVDFGAPAPVTSINSAGVSDANSFVTPDHGALYFVSNRTGTDKLHRAQRNVGGTFDAATALNLTTYAENSPAVTPDELTIVFAADDPDTATGFDIYMSTRTAISDPFGPAQLQSALNSDASEYPTWMSADGCEIYLVRMVGDATNPDLFRAKRGQ